MTGTTTCRFHPDRAAVVACNKFEYGYCESCLESCQACSDPELYCRHRTYCVIWELCRKELKKRKAALPEKDETAASASAPIPSR